MLLNNPGEKIILLGNEAVVRGALEAGVNFVSTYPGTPASEIGNVFYKISKKAGVYFEFSTNEKVAMEAAAGASLTGLRSLCAMKHFGLNIASDFLFTLAYTGVRGGMVILVADDPSCWSSAQSEQDSRYLLKTSHLPVLEPSTPQESKDFTILAFELSEKFNIPVILRHTTRTSHQSAPVVLGKIEQREKNPIFIKNPHQFSTMPPRVLEQKKELLKKIEKIRELAEKSPANYESKRITNKLGVIASGISYLYVMEALRELGLKIPVLKLGFIQPLAKKKIQKFLKKIKKVLVVEELDPFLEKEIKAIAQEIGWQGKVFGKETKGILLPKAGELKPEYVSMTIANLVDKKTKFNYLAHLRKFEKFKIPSRPAILCPGCPYWFVISAIKKVIDPREVIFGGEIGCYMIFGHKAINLQDYLYCMGSSVSVAHGISKGSRGRQKVIVFVGDSSFFHAGIPALINSVFNKSNPLIIILDNQTTAMTGHQPHPGVGRGPEEDGVEAIKIEEIVKGLGIKNWRVVDPVVNQEEFKNTLREFLEKKEVSVIIARHICALLEKRKSSL